MVQTESPSAPIVDGLSPVGQMASPDVAALKVPEPATDERAARSSSADSRLTITPERFILQLEEASLLSPEEMIDVRAGLPQFQTIEALE